VLSLTTPVWSVSTQVSVFLALAGAHHLHALLACAGVCCCLGAAAADREELQQFAEAEAEEEAEREEMLDSPAKRQRREEGTGQDFRCVW
jgi:hypothetical protein